LLIDDEDRQRQSAERGSKRRFTSRVDHSFVLYFWRSHFKFR
jgi:hypothetical protein